MYVLIGGFTACPGGGGTSMFSVPGLLPDRVFELRKMLPNRVKITAPHRHTPVHIRTKCLPRDFMGKVRMTLVVA